MRYPYFFLFLLYLLPLEGGAQVLTLGKATFSTNKGNALKSTQPNVTTDFKGPVNAATWYASLVRSLFREILLEGNF